MRYHHLGYVVPNIDKACNDFAILGYCVSEVVDDLMRNIKIAFVRKEHISVELIAPINVGSPVDNILKKMGPSPYHICYEVSSIDESIECLKISGWTLIKKPEPAIAIEGEGAAWVAFLYKKSSGLIELLQFL